MVQGKYQIVMDPPFTPGNEVCGYVEETGDDVDLKIGTKVIALPPIGGFSEYVSVDKNLVIPVSEKVNAIVKVIRRGCWVRRVSRIACVLTLQNS